jgi:hypothetical protein
VHTGQVLAGDQPVIGAARQCVDEQRAARNAELDRTVDILIHELPPLDIHQRIILAREIDAFASRIMPAADFW